MRRIVYSPRDLARSHPLNAALADNDEDIEEVGDAEEVANLATKVGEFETAAGGFGRDIEADEGADAHAVGVLEIGQIEDDTLMAGQQRANAGEEDGGGTSDKPAVAMHDGEAAGGGFDVEGEERRRCR